MSNGKFPYSFSVQYEKNSISSLHETKMFAISTSDYAVACGDRPSSPVATDEEREIFRKNEMTIKKAIEDVLSRTLPRTPCSIYIKRTPSSDYDIQCVDAVLVKVNKTPPKGYEKFYLDNHKHVCPEVWDGFSTLSK